MEKELTPEKVIEIGKLWGDAYLNSLPPGKRMAGLKPEEILAVLKTQAVAGKLSEEDIENFLKGLKKNGD